VSAEQKGQLIFKGSRAEVSAQDWGVDWQTDKDPIKVVGCNECGDAVAVNAFYSNAKVMCHRHRTAEVDSRGSSRGDGQAQAVHVGKTDPQKVADLRDVLINKQFGETKVCPVCDHAMELKCVTHNPHYGPQRRTKEGGYANSTGETVLHQCNACKCTLSMSTTVQNVLRRQNEPKTGLRASGWPELLGVREEA
jgi:hypothetical protein